MEERREGTPAENCHTRALGISKSMAGLADPTWTWAVESQWLCCLSFLVFCLSLMEFSAPRMLVSELALGKEPFTTSLPTTSSSRPDQPGGQTHECHRSLHASRN